MAAFCCAHYRSGRVYRTRSLARERGDTSVVEGDGTEMRQSYYSRKWPSPKKGINWKYVVPIAAAAITTAGYIIVALINNWFPFAQGESTAMPTVTQATALPPELKIVSVQEGQSFQHRLEGVNGTYDRIPENRQVWLIVMANNLCYPQDGPAELLRAGRWEHAPVEFPGDGEQQLRAALVSAEAAVELRSAVGREGIRCDRPGVEVIDSITVKVAPGTLTPTPILTSTPTAPPVSPLAPFEGRVCEIRIGQDRNKVYLRQAEFNTLGLPAGSVVNVVVLDTGGRVDNITIDVDASLSTCAVRLSTSLRTPLGLADDTEIEPPEDRPDRRFTITRSEIMVEITSLADGQEVPENVSLVSGTYRNIPTDRELWMVVFVGANYFPQNGPAVLLPDGTWNHGSISFGGIGDFVVYAVLVDAQGALLFENRQGIPALPDGALVLDAVNVHRSQ